VSVDSFTPQLKRELVSSCSNTDASLCAPRLNNRTRSAFSAWLAFLLQQTTITGLINTHIMWTLIPLWRDF